MTRSSWTSHTRRSQALLAMLVVGASLVSCGGGGGDNGGGTGPGPGTPGITIDPNGLTVAVNGAGQLTASVRDSNGAVVSDAGIVWTSLASPIATVSLTGLVTGNAIGLTSVIASLGEQADTVPVAVVDVVDDSLSIEVLPHSATVAVGGTANFSAIVRNRSGTIVPTPPDLLWSSSNPAIGVVVVGVAAGVAPGEASIRASLGGITSPPAVLTVTGTERPCNNVSMVPFFRIHGFYAIYNGSSVTTDNDEVIVSHWLEMSGVVQALGGILPASEWEGSIEGIGVRASANDKVTHNSDNPVTVETLRADGPPVTGSGRSMLRLTIDESNCTFTLTANPFMHATLVNPAANPTTETGDIALGVETVTAPLGNWSAGDSIASGDLFAQGYFPGSPAAEGQATAYYPFGFGIRLWSGNNLQTPIGEALVGYKIFAHP